MVYCNVHVEVRWSDKTRFWLPLSGTLVYNIRMDRADGKIADRFPSRTTTTALSCLPPHERSSSSMVDSLIDKITLLPTQPFPCCSVPRLTFDAVRHSDDSLLALPTCYSLNQRDQASRHPPLHPLQMMLSVLVRPAHSKGFGPRNRSNTPQTRAVNMGRGRFIKAMLGGETGTTHVHRLRLCSFSYCFVVPSFILNCKFLS